jgi:hypothetical protein
VRLSEALEQTPTGALRRVASAHALPHDDSTTRAELIARVAERLGDAVYVGEQLDGLPDDERAVLMAARHSAGELRGLLADMDHPGAAEALAERGWLYRVFAAAGPMRGEVYVVPDELLAVLPTPDHAEPAPFAHEPPPPERRWSDPAFSLFALASALTRAGGNLEDEVRPWSEEPGRWAWDARWMFLQQLATSAGLLTHRADGKLTAGSALTRLLDDPPAVSERLWRAYLSSTAWSELARAGVDDGADLADTIALRRAILDAFDGLPEQRWVGLEAFSSWLQRTRPTLVREQLNPRGLVRLQAAPWADLEAPFLKSVVLGPLYWLGVVSASRDGNLIARRSRPRPAAAEACHWEAAAELLAPARAPLGALLQAERYLVLLQRDRTSRYHLIQPHVAAALSVGGSFAECRQLLERLTRQPLPPVVDERLEAWEQRFGALEIRPTVVLEARSAAELDEALADERTRPFVRARLGPSAAEVAAADALELAVALRQSGHLPRVDAALRLAAEPRRAYAGLVDEQVLEFLLVSLLAFRTAWPERLAELEGSTVLLERLEHQFPPERLAELRASAARLAGTLHSPPPPRTKRARRKPRRTT